MNKSHSWILLENPRNGKVKIHACSDCGAMKLSNTDFVSECKPRTTLSKSLKGWKQPDLAA